MSGRQSDVSARGTSEGQHDFSRPRPLRRADASPRRFSVTAGPAGYRQTLIALKSVDDIP